MAGEVLQTFAQLLAAFPDNTSNLIVPVAERDSLWALPLDFGEIQEDSSFAIPMTDGVWADIPTLMTSAVLDVGRAWDADANNKLIPIWTDFITVNDPTNRGVSYTLSAVVEKAGVLAPFGGNWRFADGDGAPAAGDINFHSNETQARWSHTDDDGGDRQAELESIQIGDILNNAGIWRQVTADPVLNAADVEYTFLSIPRPEPTGGGDTALASQILRTGDSPYELRVTSGGVQQGQTRSFAVSESAQFISLNEFGQYNAALRLPWSFEIRPVGHSNDLTALFALHRTFGVLI